MIEQLVNIANALDNAGFHSHANAVDGLVIKLAGHVGRGAQNFIDDLKKGLERAALSEETFPTISEKSLQDIYKVIDIVAEHGRDYTGGTGPSASFFEAQKEGIMDFVDGAIELENSVRKVQDQLSKTTRPDEAEELNKILKEENDSYLKLLEEVHKKFKEGNRPDDAAKYEKFRAILEQRRKEMGW